MITATVTEGICLEDFLANPPEHMEWVNGQLVEKTGMTLRHSRIQAALVWYWKNYKNESGQGGEVFVELPCRTSKQGRCPDVAYLTYELLMQFGEESALPQSPPLVGEIASPDDSAEVCLAKRKSIWSQVLRKFGSCFPKIVGCWC